MSQLPRYESYKDSGVQWLGEIPSHWAVKKLKFLTSYFKGFAFKSEDFSDIGIPLIKASNVKKFSIENVDSHIAFEKVQDAFDRVKLQEGDLILSTVGSLPNVLNSAVGQIAYVSPDFEGSYLNQNNVCFRSNEKVLPIFLKYFVMSSFFRRNLDVKALWIANQAYLEVLDVQNISIIFPDLEEQKVIVDFLDKRLAQVDALIAKQGILLEKLAEQRVALISHAVTKGLNPDVEMKESDVEWLGNIPKHWDTKKLKFSVGCNLKTLTDKTDSDYEILYVDISNVSLTAGIKNKEELLFENAPSRARRVVKSGDVLVSTVRTYLKAITYVESAEDNLIASTGFAVLSPLDILDSKFLGYWIQSEGMIGSIVANSVGVSYPAINSSVLVSLPIVDIPLEEQKAISSYLDMEIETINRQVKLVNSSIEKLKEYRSTLITQVVTGKIDVRNLKVN